MTLRRAARVVGPAFAALGILLALVPAPPASATFPGANGALLNVDLYTPDGQRLDLGLQNYKGLAAFNRQGDAIAYVAEPPGTPQGDSTTENVLRVRRSDGTDTLVPGLDGQLAGNMESLSWSPDGRHLAVLLRLAGTRTNAVLRVALDGSGVTELAKGEYLEHVDWNPVQDLISFTVGHKDVFTVPGSGGTPVQQTSQCVYEGGNLDAADCRGELPGRVFMADPEWSPDGTRLLVLVNRRPDSGPVTWSVGLLVPGQQEPTEVVPLKFAGDAATFFVRFPTVWSPDGSSVLYNDINDPDSRTADTYAVPVSGGAARRIREGFVDDWQPCPSGACPRFVVTSLTPHPGAAPRVSLSHTRIAPGQATTATWSGRPGETIEILSRTQPATTFSRIGSVTLDDQGRGTSTHRPQKNTRLTARASTGEASQDQPLVQVTSLVSLNVQRTGGRTYAFSGRVYPALAGRLVNLYRYGRLVAQARCDAAGVYRVTRALPEGPSSLQARTADDTSNAGAESPLRRVEVR